MTKHYEENFKKQIVNIYNQGNHSLRDLSKEYGMSTSTLMVGLIGIITPNHLT